MLLDHERLDVYHLALDFLVFANGVIEALPRNLCPLALVQLNSKHRGTPSNTTRPQWKSSLPSSGTGTGTFTGAPCIQGQTLVRPSGAAL